MKCLVAAALAALLSGVPVAPLAAQSPQQRTNPPNPAPSAASDQPSLQTVGRVGTSSYGWTNGMGWFTLDESAKAAMLDGIEQGVVLSVRENWKEMPKDAQQTLVKTAERMTVGGIAFNDLVEQMDEFYLDAPNIGIPVVDAYLYTLMKFKKAPPDELKSFLDTLHKTYKSPVELPKKSGKKP